MTTQQPKLRYTYDDYCQLPEGERYELIDGILYMAPAPVTKHQRISRAFFDRQCTPA